MSWIEKYKTEKEFLTAMRDWLRDGLPDRVPEPDPKVQMFGNKRLKELWTIEMGIPEMLRRYFYEVAESQGPTKEIGFLICLDKWDKGGRPTSEEEAGALLERPKKAPKKPEPKRVRPAHTPGFVVKEK